MSAGNTFFFPPRVALQGQNLKNSADDWEMSRPALLEIGIRASWKSKESSKRIFHVQGLHLVRAARASVVICRCMVFIRAYIIPGAIFACYCLFYTINLGGGLRDGCFLKW